MKIIKYLFWDFYRFLKTLFTFGKMKASPLVAMDRMSKCENCKEIKYEERFFKYRQPRCSRCGCFLKMKVRLAWEVCPDNPPRWEEEK